MKKFIIFFLLIASPVFAADTKEMSDFTALTTGAYNDYVWVYDTSASALKRMTVEEFIEDYLTNPNGTLNISGASVYASGSVNVQTSDTGRALNVGGTGIMLENATALYSRDSGANLRALLMKDGSDTTHVYSQNNKDLMLGYPGAQVTIDHTGNVESPAIGGFESGVSTPAATIWQAPSGESIFVTGTDIYFSDSAGTDHKLN